MTKEELNNEGNNLEEKNNNATSLIEREIDYIIKINKFKSMSNKV